MSRLFHVKEKDIDDLIAKSDIKLDDVLVVKRRDKLIYYCLNGSSGGSYGLTIQPNVTERYDDAFAHFFDVLKNVSSATISIYPWCSTAKKHFGHIDARVSLITLYFQKGAMCNCWVAIHDCEANVFVSSTNDCWKRQHFDAVSGAISNDIDTFLEPQTSLLFVVKNYNEELLRLLQLYNKDQYLFVQRRYNSAGKSITVRKDHHTVDELVEVETDVVVYVIDCPWKKQREIMQQVRSIVTTSNAELLRLRFHRFKFVCAGVDKRFVHSAPSYYEIRPCYWVSTRTVQNQIVKLAMVLCELFEPYVVLWIISWLPTVSLLPRYKTVEILENVKRHIHKREANKDAMHTQSRIKIE